jgi:hypothetical protein
MYKLIIFQDVEQQQPIFIGYFRKISDITEYTNGIIKYSDTNKKAILRNKYMTFKRLFKIVKI